MTIKSGAVVVLSCVLLAACASPQEIATKKAAAEQVAQAEREKRCASFGYQRGTPTTANALRTCMCRINRGRHSRQQMRLQDARQLRTLFRPLGRLYRR